MNKLLLPTLALVLIVAAASTTRAHDVGVAAIDITPDYKVRLNGFGHRKSESDGVTAKIYAKALAIRKPPSTAASSSSSNQGSSGATCRSTCRVRTSPAGGGCPP